MARALAYQQLLLSVRYRSVLFPFDALEFIAALRKNGYLPTQEISGVPFGARLQVSGIIARKAETSIQLDTDKQVVGIHCPNPNSAVDELGMLESLLRHDFNLDTSGLADFYELMAGITTRSDKSPARVLEQAFGDLPILRRLSEAIGKSAFPFGIRLAPQGLVPNGSDWFDIQLEPSILRPNDTYQIRVVYRNSARADVVAFTNRLEGFLAALIGAIET